MAGGQGVYQKDPEDGSDKLVAVLCWAGAAKHLKDRDTWIGWDAVTCANRLKLAVQLRRFVVPEGFTLGTMDKAIRTLTLTGSCKRWRSAA